MKTGADLRDLGIARVTASNPRWIDLAVAEVRKLRTRRKGHPDRFMAEAIRRFTLKTVGPPNSDKAWGALTRRLALEGVIKDVGRTGTPKDPRSHACRKPIYRWR
ncbi:MAG TPA: hypothetical protein VF077_10310 [Nitrospiraceae bacterium]